MGEGLRDPSEFDRLIFSHSQNFGEPARSRTENQQIKSLLLCQLSYGPDFDNPHRKEPMRDEQTLSIAIDSKNAKLSYFSP
jgi:hypothetical protein